MLGSEDVQNIQGRSRNDKKEDLKLPREVVFGKRPRRHEHTDLQTLSQ